MELNISEAAEDCNTDDTWRCLCSCSIIKHSRFWLKTRRKSTEEDHNKGGDNLLSYRPAERVTGEGISLVGLVLRVTGRQDSFRY